MRAFALAALAALVGGSLHAQSSPVYHGSTLELIARGQQALTVCNGLFESHRTLEQIYAGELRADGVPQLPPAAMRIDSARRLVEVRGDSARSVPPMRAAYRDGVGCVVMAPNQSAAQLDSLPLLRMPAAAGDASNVPWPDGDLLPSARFPRDVRRAALERAGDWAFDRTRHGGTPSQVTTALLVVHRGRIVYERYAPGFDVSTRTRTWSTAKSIASTLAGIAVGRGLLELDAPLPFDWPPDEFKELRTRFEGRSPLVVGAEWPPRSYDRATDPRRRITLRHVLHMSSGLYPMDNEYRDVYGSGLSYFAGWSSAHNARDRGLVREPGTVWDYENNDALLVMYALRSALRDPRAYLEFPRRALFDRIGMRNTVAGVDRFGDFVMSSQVYTNARDLARLGLLYLNRGMWNGERVLPEAWVDFARTPAPATARFGNFYGGQFWLVPDSRTDLPQDAYTTAGSQGQYAIIVPSYELVIVRRGLDGPGAGFPTWDLLAEVLKALPPARGGAKPRS